MSPIQAMIAREAAAETLASEFAEWLQSALPGEACEYHRGHLAADRNPIVTRLGESDRFHLDRTADLALVMAATGRVELVQRRLGDGVFSYLAVKAAARRPRSTSRPFAA